MRLVSAGMAHPADVAGKAMIKERTDFIGRHRVRPHVIFLADAAAERHVLVPLEMTRVLWYR